MVSEGVDRNILERWRHRIRELVLLEQAERESHDHRIQPMAGVPIATRAIDGKRRQDLRGPTQIAVAIGLYRNACSSMRSRSSFSKDP